MKKEVNILGRRTVRAKGEGADYPALKGKVISKVSFASDQEFTALVMEFEDNTLASFRLRASIALAMEPELATVQRGNLTGWRVLKKRPATRRVFGPTD